MILKQFFFSLDTSELKLINNTFEMAKGVAELKLTESELALYSASVLLSPGKYAKIHFLCCRGMLGKKLGT